MRTNLNSFLTHLHIDVARILGTTKMVSAKDSQAFTKEIGKYVDSKDQKRTKKDTKEKSKEPNLMDKVRKSAGMATKNTASSNQGDTNGPALWPLIRQVNVRCSAEALSTGAVLVDLPGKVHLTINWRGLDLSPL